MVCGWSWSRKMNERSSAISALISSRSSSSTIRADLVAQASSPAAERRRPAPATGAASARRSTARGRRSRRTASAGSRGVGDPGQLTRCRGSRFSPSETAAEEAGADRHRRRQVRVEAGRAGAAADVDRHPQHLHRGAVGHDRARVVRVDHRRVAGAADAQHRAGGVDAAAGVGHAHEAEQREELLARERLLGHDQRRTARPARGSSAARGCPALARPAGAASCRPGRAAMRPSGKSVSRTAAASSASSTWAPWRSSSRSNCVGAALLDDQRTTRSCTGSSCRSLGVDQPLGGRGEVGGVRRRAPGTLPGPDADRRVAGAVGGAHDRDAAGGQDHVGASGRVISASISGIVGSSTTWMHAVRGARRDGGLGEQSGGVGADTRARADAG